MSRVIMGFALLATLLATGHAMAADPPRLPGVVVHFPSTDATVLDGRLLRPDGPGPFPALVALHGCGGLYRRGGTEVNARDRDWALLLRDQGYVVLLVDSFGPRGHNAVCKLAERPVRQEVERKADAVGALAYLRARPDVRPDRVGLIGWSHGGGTALATQGNPPPADYRAAVSFYPGCQRSVKRTDWALEAPLLLLVGEADDWTPAGPCRVLAARPGLNGLLELVTYPGATHDFDAPGSTTVRTVTGIPSVKSGTVHIAADPAAREDAVARVSRFLARWLNDGG